MNFIEWLNALYLWSKCIYNKPHLIIDHEAYVIEAQIFFDRT